MREGVSLSGVRLGVLGCLALALGAGSMPHMACAQDLGSEVRRAIAACKAGDVRLGVCVVDVPTGEVLAEFHADEQFMPASNMKLLTSGTALLTLGPGYQFRTEIISAGERLIVRGSGDPALGDPEVLKISTPPMTVDDVLAGLAGAVAKSGVGPVSEVVIDDRVFDRENTHGTWNKANYLHAYSAEVWGLNFHANTVRFFPKPNPQGAGSPPLFELEPSADWLSIANRAQTTRQSHSTMWASRAPGDNQFTLMGEIGALTNVQFDVTVHDVPQFFGRLLVQRLEKAGVRFAGGAPPVRLARLDEALAPGRVVAVVTTPLSVVLERCNTDSENLYAESLLKATGHSVTHEAGSWSNGAAVVRMMLTEKLGPAAAAATEIADGSGLSRQNRVTPRTFTSWLRFMAGTTGANLYVGSLAEPGKPGTLERRFRGVRLENALSGKSGYINQVRSLSGYLTNASTGHRVAFSILANDVTNDADASVLRLHEEIVKAADQWLARRASLEQPKNGG